MAEERESGIIEVYADLENSQVIFEVGATEGEGDNEEEYEPDFLVALDPEIAFELARRLTVAGYRVQDNNNAA